MTGTHLEPVTIEHRFRGPASSGNGGWTAGLVATRLSDTTGHAGPVTVTLRMPPPLDAPLDVQLDDDAGRPGARLFSGDLLVAEAVVASPEALGNPVEPVDVDTARATAAGYAGLQQHPFPECFVCGTARGVGDGLRLAPGPLAPGRTACTWTAQADLGAPFVWAALDCPGGWTDELGGRPMVLGRMTAHVEAAVEAGVTYVVVGQRRAVEERKTHTATTLYDPDGRVVGRAAHTWVRVDPARFAPRT